MGTYGQAFEYAIKEAKSPLCPFGSDCYREHANFEYTNDSEDTVEHLLMRCSCANNVKLRQLLATFEIPTDDIATWTGCNQALSVDDNAQIIALFEKFIINRETLLAT